MLDKLLQGALQGMMGGQNTQQDPLLQILGSLLSNSGGSGGLGALIQQFQQAGYGQQAQSWVGRGQNMPISVEDLMRVFGADTMQQMAGRAGLDQQQFGGRMAEALPQMVDQLTPDGEVPSGGIDDALATLSRMMPR
jgi:uncharacterized protein YidB (DUF937 family)